MKESSINKRDLKLINILTEFIKISEQKKCKWTRWIVGILNEEYIKLGSIYSGWNGAVVLYFSVLIFFFFFADVALMVVEQ